MKKKMPKMHILPSDLVDGRHNITVSVIGAGGTGSHVLTNLAMINASLRDLRMKTFRLIAYDYDVVEKHNVGRQVFSPADVGRNKADCIIERINRYYGFSWSSFAVKYGSGMNRESARNITISCVDSVKSRQEIIQHLYACEKSYSIESVPYYLLDIGNSRKTGQVLLSTIRKVKQPSTKGYVNMLPTFIDEYPDAKDIPGDNESCSTAESLTRQDLFINKILATYASAMLWSMFRNFMVINRGVYVNLETFESRPIPL